MAEPVQQVVLLDAPVNLYKINNGLYLFHCTYKYDVTVCQWNQNQTRHIPQTFLIEFSGMIFCEEVATVFQRRMWVEGKVKILHGVTVENYIIVS